MDGNILIYIKPLSVNKAWQGKRYKTKEYLSYEDIVASLLPNNFKIPQKKLCIYYEFGISSKSADLDNLIKPFQDILQKKYDFNDKMIYKIVALKVDVKKGDEFIMCKIKSIKNVLDK